MNPNPIAVSVAPEYLVAGAIYRDLFAQFTNVASGSAWPGNAPLLIQASGQVPIATKISVNNNNAYAEALLQVMPQILDHDPVAPYTAPNFNVFTTVKTVGDDAEPLIRYWHELDAVRHALHERRGSDAQEKFMFDVVGPFIENNGAKAIQDLDMTLETMPRSARYYFPYLLGHLQHEPTEQERLNALDRYRMSDDEDVRDGAVEALGHLSAA